MGDQLQESKAKSKITDLLPEIEAMISSGSCDGRGDDIAAAMIDVWRARERLSGAVTANAIANGQI